MFRTAASQTSKLPLWRLSAQCYSTEATEALSERIGAGRGKAIANADADPFALFLSKKDNASPQNERRFRNDKKKGNGVMSFKNNNNNQRNRKEPVEGQFDDQPEAKKMASDNANKSFDRQKDNKRKPMNRKPGVRHEAVRTNRATSFIDKDIDWNSLDVIPVQATMTVDGQQTEIKDDDYMSYLSAGADIKWSESVKGDHVRTLVGTNPSLDLQQKTAFLAAVASATSAQRVVANR